MDAMLMRADGSAIAVLRAPAGADGGGRTRTALRPRDFKSALIPYPVCIQEREVLR